MKSKSWTVFLALIAAAFGVLAARLLWTPGAHATLKSGTLLPEPRTVVPFKLVAEDGKPFANADLGGHWNLIFTGYTHCPDVCPTTLSLLKGTMARLGAQADAVQVVFLSIDPERDTPEALERYVHYFNPRFRAATGPSAELEILGANLGFVFAKIPGPAPESYSMDHSAALILVDPQGRLAGYFTPPFNAEALAADLSTVLKRS
jgi:protein SCO1/2